MAGWARLALATLYPVLASPLFWLADATQTEKPYAQRVASIHGFIAQADRRARQASQRHCYVFARAPLPSRSKATLGQLWSGRCCMSKAAARRTDWRVGSSPALA